MTYYVSRRACMFIRFFLIFTLFIFNTFASGLNAPANILAAGNNKFVLPVLIQSFYRKYPNSRVVVQYGATGDLTNSILNGVNYDILLGGNMEYPQKIYDAKKAIFPPKEYARGSLILFVPADNALSQKKLKVLKNKKIKHITIANRQTAPYGKASFEVLEKSDAGFLSKSAIQSLPIGYRQEGVNWIEVDETLYKPIIQGYVISKNGSKNINALRFIEFLFSKDGRAIYKEYGYK